VNNDRYAAIAVGGGEMLERTDDGLASIRAKVLLTAQAFIFLSGNPHSHIMPQLGQKIHQDINGEFIHFTTL